METLSYIFSNNKIIHLTPKCQDDLGSSYHASSATKIKKINIHCVAPVGPLLQDFGEELEQSSHS
jgi:hypothetical protein